jgi:hypothetical protein
MPVARMVHYNSPEEIAKREAAAAAPSGAAPPSKTFTHYNSPSEIAKREAAAGHTVEVIQPPQQPSAETLPVQQGDLETRVRRLEVLLLAFCKGPAEAREFRRLLNNVDAVVDVQQDINNRVRALEQSFDGVQEFSDVDETANAIIGSDPTALPDEAPAPTPTEEGST